MRNMNRLANSTNKYQGAYKKVLCVCSAGLLRSPTTALVLAQEYDYNTRAAGIDTEFALIPVDEVLLNWADEIVCLEQYHADKILGMLEDVQDGGQKKIVILDIEDRYKYRDPELVNEIKIKYKNAIQMEELLERQQSGNRDNGDGLSSS